MKNKASIVFLGDSLTEWGNWQTWFPDYHVHNLGIAGERSDQVIKRLSETVPIQPKTIFVMMGINDLGNGAQKETIIKNWAYLLDFFEKELPNTKTFIQSILPYHPVLWNNSLLSLKKVLETNNLLKQLAIKHQHEFISLFELFTNKKGWLREELTNDGLHLNAAGYQVWRDVVNEYL